MTETYQGTPCKRGGHTERYVIGGDCVACTKKRNKKWAKENPEQNKANGKRWRTENAEQNKANGKRWRTENPEYHKKYKKENSGLVNHISALRRARIKQQTPPWADLEKIKQIYIDCPRGYHVDHRHPLSKGGLHVHWNLKAIPATENLKKHTKLDYER